MKPKEFHNRAWQHLDTAERLLNEGKLDEADRELNAAWLALEHNKWNTHADLTKEYARLKHLTAVYSEQTNGHKKETQP